MHAAIREASNEKRWRFHEGFRHLSDVRQVAVGCRWSSALCLSDRERLVRGRFHPPPDFASRSEPSHDYDVQVCVVGSVTHSKLLAASWSGTAWGTSGWSCTGWSTSSRSCTARGRSGTRWRWSATATSLRMEQASVGAVDAGETNQRGGNPNVLHLTSPNTIGAVERERLPRT